MTPASPRRAPASLLRTEISQQPEVAARLLASAGPPLDAVARAVHARGIRFVVFAARGTSDNAAIYGQYVLGLRNRLPVALATPSLTTLYGATPRYDDALVVGVSQSGVSPDIVGVVVAARTQGALTLAVTNDPHSPLASAAEHVVELRAGEERSVAATKTYTAQLVVLAMLSLAMAPDESAAEGLAAVPEALASALATDPEAARIAADQASLDRAIVLGRGPGYATAREWGMKLKEIAAVAADPYSAADFAHGPMTLLRPGGVVLAAVQRGAALAATVADLRRLRDDRGAELLVLSDDADARALGRWSLPVPAGHPEWLDPIVSIVPAQLHAVHLGLARGVDPDRPYGLRKVTLTR